ncbi:MAG: GeoRSP system SPASM domain protein [Pelobacteraceae bacterium]
MELALPITVYWDLAPNTPFDDALLRICDGILECRPLMLQLFDPSPELSEGARAILKRFRETPVSVSLTLRYSNLLSLAGASINELDVKELLLVCDSLDSIGDMTCQPEVGLSFFVSSGNWRELPKVVSFCRDHGINRLILPMQRLYNGETPFLLSAIEQKLLENALKAVGGTAGLRLTIHDPFLWRAFNPGIPFPQGGCQAANTMIAIAPDGGVYPCPTLPERLGEIGATSLKDIIASPAKKELRGRIRHDPVACGSCLEISACHGGCRGRSYVLHGSFDEIDDACR